MEKKSHGIVRYLHVQQVRLMADFDNMSVRLNLSRRELMVPLGTQFSITWRACKIVPPTRKQLQLETE